MNNCFASLRNLKNSNYKPIQNLKPSLKLFSSLTLFFIILTILSMQTAQADVISLNAGGSQEIAVTPDKYVEGFFFGIAEEAAVTPTPTPTPIQQTPIIISNLEATRVSIDKAVNQSDDVEVEFDLKNPSTNYSATNLTVSIPQSFSSLVQVSFLNTTIEPGSTIKYLVRIRDIQESARITSIRFLFDY